jgi:hypothetical protein
MNSGHTVFPQALSHLPAHEFHRWVSRYGGDGEIVDSPAWIDFSPWPSRN